MSSANNDEFLITLRNVYKSYYSGEVETKVFEDLSLDVKKGELLVILGVSGCGKTTFLNLIGGLDKSTIGKVIVDGMNLTQMSWRELTDFRKQRIGFVFQFYNLIPTLTAQENVEVGLEVLGLDRSEVETRSIKYLELVGLKDKLDKFPSQLSGGEQQRVAIARSLAKYPKMIIADEPTGNLDERTASIIIELMKDARQMTQASLVVATHNREFTKIADRVLHIKDLKII